MQFKDDRRCLIASSSATIAERIHHGCVPGSRRVSLRELNVDQQDDHGTDDSTDPSGGILKVHFATEDQ